MSEIVVIPLAFYYICTFFSCLVLLGVGYYLKCKQNVLTCHSQLYWADNTYFWRQSHVIMDFLMMMHIISRWSGKCLVWVRSFKILFFEHLGLKNAIHQQKFLVTTPLEGTMILKNHWWPEDYRSVHLVRQPAKHLWYLYIALKR